jgi:hypothetical protein
LVIPDTLPAKLAQSVCDFESPRLFFLSTERKGPNLIHVKPIGNQVGWKARKGCAQPFMQWDQAGLVFVPAWGA